MLDAAATLEAQLIAAQSELEGLRQIYADNFIRVRAVRARIEELQKHLQQLSGGDLANTANAEEHPLYPSIRKVAIIGVTYSDLYRRTKIQETLFELLTQQCELAKVQEAKETPSVKVLDEPFVPERKSFPPRLLIMFIFTLFALMIAAIWILGRATWENLGPHHPGKILAQDTYNTIKADLTLHTSGITPLDRVRSRLFRFKRPPNRFEQTAFPPACVPEARTQRFHSINGGAMRILVLGGDGYCGWPTSLYLSRQGHDIAIADGFQRRSWDHELGAQTLTPIRPLTDRLRAWQRCTGHRLKAMSATSLTMNSSPV